MVAGDRAACGAVLYGVQFASGSVWLHPTLWAGAKPTRVVLKGVPIRMEATAGITAAVIWASPVYHTRPFPGTDSPSCNERGNAPEREKAGGGESGADEKRSKKS